MSYEIWGSHGNKDDDGDSAPVLRQPIKSFPNALLGLNLESINSDKSPKGQN